MSQNLLVTKLYIPPNRRNLVSRPRLFQLLNEGSQQGRKLSLISAPAGYGKTTLITDWLRGIQGKSTWLSLDKNDNDPTRFLTYLIAALQQVDEHMGESTRAMLQSPQPLPLETLLTPLINQIAAVPTPFLLVLDDYHVIETLQIHQQLSFLVEHQPPQMHLIILTREDPPLPLARLRACGQIAEIRQADLRFTTEECGDFLRRVMGLPLTTGDITALEHRTEGWIAGLQLAALSMQGRNDLPDFIEAFSGGSHYVLEYLIEEVFNHQPLDVQDFLLKTSILDRLSGPLCDVLTEKTASGSLLEQLEQANLFIISLDQSNTWYRYHHLFVDLLRQRLRATDAIDENRLHRLASQWFASRRFLPEAIHHALAGSDWQLAAELIGESSVIILRSGELMTLLGWFKSLPEEVIFERPHLCRDYGWALSLTGQLDAANVYLRQAEAVVRGNDALLGEILVAQAYNLRSGGDNLQAIERAQRALTLLPQADALSRGLAALTLGLAHLYCNNLKEAEQAFKEAEQAAQLSRNPYARLTALTYLGVIQAIFGRLYRAAEFCRLVILAGGQSPPVAPAYVELGALLYEQNKLEDAARHLQIGIELSQRSGNLMIQSDGYRTLARLQQTCGETDTALATLEKADQLARNYAVTPLTRIRNAACHVQLALAQDNLAAALYWSEQVTEAADASPFYLRLGLTPARLLLAQNKKTGASEKLSQLFEIAFQAGWVTGLVEIRVLQALAAAIPADALNLLTEALKLAQPEGFIRTFVDKGEPLKALLERLRSQGGELKEYIQTLLSAFGQPSETSPSQPLVEPLSERELAVLRLVSQGLSNGEIATRLIVSVGTVKTHVHSIIAKIGVSSRTQAVARARELELL